MKTVVYTETAPMYWLQYLINGDTSDMTEQEVAECDRWLELVSQTSPQSGLAFMHISASGCSEGHYGRWDGIGMQLFDYDAVYRVVEQTDRPRDDEGRTAQDRYDDDCIEQYGSISLEDKNGY